MGLGDPEDHELRTSLGMVVRSNMDPSETSYIGEASNDRDGYRRLREVLKRRGEVAERSRMTSARQRRLGIPSVTHVETKVASENLIPKALKDYSETLAKYKYAKECLDKAEAEVKRVTDGKLPKRFVVGTEYIVVAIDAGNIKIHVQQIDGIFGHPGNPMPATGGRY